MTVSDLLNSGAALVLTVLFYTITNTAPSTERVISGHWQAVRQTPGGHWRVLLAELLGVGLRCVAIWVLAWLLKLMPWGNAVSAALMLLFAALHTLGRTVKHLPARAGIGPGRAFAVIVAAEFGLNLDNVAASAVDVTMDVLALSLLLFMVLMVVVKATPLGRRSMAALLSALDRMDHPVVAWRRASWPRRLAVAAPGLALALVLVPLLPLAWRSLLGIWRLHHDVDELGTGVWVFILVLLAVVSLFDAPTLALASQPWDRQCQALLADLLGPGLGPTAGHDVLKWCAGVAVAMVAAFLFLPPIERRAARGPRATAAAA